MDEIAVASEICGFQTLPKSLVALNPWSTVSSFCDYTVLPSNETDGNSN
jgi:hypothetical protein